MMPRLFIDLDGVLADFDSGFVRIFGENHKEMTDDLMWSYINSHPSFFKDLHPMLGALEFWNSVEHMSPVILTACPKTNYTVAAQQKREWVRQHISSKVMILPVLGGKNKPLFMDQPGDILIDDWIENVEAWRAAGGRGILHKSFVSTKRQVHDVLWSHVVTEVDNRPPPNDPRWGSWYTY